VADTLAVLAFTFGRAASRFDVRRGPFIDEADAISAICLHRGLLPEPLRTEVRADLARVDPTDASKDVGHPLAMGGTELERHSPADRELKRLESEAGAARRGLWSHPNPVPPREWRNGERVPQTAEVVGDRRSRVDHRPTGRGAANMSEENRVAFKTPAEAEAAGYRRARDC
jgi:hypothetical protein